MKHTDGHEIIKPCFERIESVLLFLLRRWNELTLWKFFVCFAVVLGFIPQGVDVLSIWVHCWQGWIGGRCDLGRDEKKVFVGRIECE